MNIFDIIGVFITLSIFLRIVNIVIFFLTKEGETVLKKIIKKKFLWIY